MVKTIIFIAMLAVYMGAAFVKNRKKPGASRRMSTPAGGPVPPVSHQAGPDFSRIMELLRQQETGEDLAYTQHQDVSSGPLVEGTSSLSERTVTGVAAVEDPRDLQSSANNNQQDSGQAAGEPLHGKKIISSGRDLVVYSAIMSPRFEDF